jgi:ubiquinone/menaquinone biosynthesis C-methylase UbiE
MKDDCYNEDQYYDTIADGYDELYSKEQENKLNIIKKNITVRKNTRILDIGCGTGASMDFDCFCIGIDPSKRSIEIAVNKDKNRDHEYKVGKAEDIPTMGFKDNEFDYVISISAIHHVIQIHRVIKELKRVGKEAIITIPKKSIKKQKIINTINSNFNINLQIEEDKDIILFCRKPGVRRKQNKQKS